MPRIRAFWGTCLLFTACALTIGFVPSARAWQTTHFSANAFALSADGTRLAVVTRFIDSSVTTDGVYYPIDIYNAVDGSFIKAIEPVWPMASKIAFSPDGTMLAYVAQDSIGVVDIDTQEPLYAVSGEDHDHVQDAAWSPVGGRLVVVMDNKLVLVNPRDNSAIVRLHKSDDNGFYSAAWNSDGQKIAVMTRTDGLEIWDVSELSGTLVLSINCDCHSGFAWRPDGKAVAITIPSGVQVFDVKTGQAGTRTPVENYYDYITSIAWNQDGTRLAAGVSGPLTIFDASLQRTLSTQKVNYNVYGLVWSPKGNLFYSDDVGHIYRNGQMFALNTPQFPARNVPHSHQTVKFDIQAMAASNDGKLLALSGRHIGGTTNPYNAYFPIDLFDASTGMLLSSIEEPSCMPSSLGFSPDTAQLAYAGDDNCLGVIDVVSQTPLFQQGGTIGGLYAPGSVAWSSTGERVAIADAYGVTIFNMRQQNTEQGLDSVEVNDKGTLTLIHASYVGINWIGTINRLVTATKDQIQVWNLDQPSGHPEKLFASRDISTMVVNPVHAEIVAAGSAHGVVRFFSFAKGYDSFIQVGDTGDVTALAWSPDGTQLAAGALNQVVVFDGAAKTVQSTYSVRGNVDGLMWTNTDLFFYGHFGLYRNGLPFVLRNEVGEESVSPPVLTPLLTPIPTYSVGG